jgi:hypothetical protein
VRATNCSANETEGQPNTDWNAIHWRKVEKSVSSLRRRIFRASKEGDHRKVRSLQKLALRSYADVIQSVRKVTQINAGKDTPGVDMLVVKTPKARSHLVDHIRSYQPWRAKPARRVYIPKGPKGGAKKKRPLGIPTIHDRAMQAIVKNTLEPYWEARFEPASYGFRPGRSCHDAIAKVFDIEDSLSLISEVLQVDLQRHARVHHQAGRRRWLGRLSQRRRGLRVRFPRSPRSGGPPRGTGPGSRGRVGWVPVDGTAHVLTRGCAAVYGAVLRRPSLEGSALHGAICFALLVSLYCSAPLFPQF